MIREELALVKQNGAWKPRRKKGWSGLFYPPNGLNFQFCWFNLFFFIAPSWSESNFILFYFFIRSELLRVGPSWSGPTFVPAYSFAHCFSESSFECVSCRNITSAFLFRHQVNIVLLLWKLLMPLTFKETNLNKSAVSVVFYKNAYIVWD